MATKISGLVVSRAVRSTCDGARLLVVVGATASLAMSGIGCGQAPPLPEDEALGHGEQEVFGNSVIDVTIPQMPLQLEAAVFRLNRWQWTGSFYEYVGFCTGTAIKSDLILTAGHCLCGRGLDEDTAQATGLLCSTKAEIITVHDASNESSACPPGSPSGCALGPPCVDPSQLPPSAHGLQMNAHACARVSEARLTTQGMAYFDDLGGWPLSGVGTGDVALLPLDQAIDPSVAIPISPLISDQPALAAVKAADATVVGYGTDIPDTYPSIRRLGFIGNLGWRYDHQLLPELGFVYSSERVPGETDMTEHGDSGGPLLAYSEDLKRVVVLGVTSGTIDAHGTYIWAHGGGGLGEGFYSVWAPNTSWMEEHLDDADSDGVRDAIDNCPPHRCVNSLDCANPYQQDHDGDGVGDRCDNCPAVFCETNPQFPAHLCVNPADESGEQADSDNDGVGDRCDPCPNDPSDGVLDRRDTALGSGGWLLTTDDDLDGVGNACDRCPDLDIPLDSCGLGAFCPPVGDEPVDCMGGYWSDGIWLTGRCAEMGDADEDGRGDACDTCPTVPDYGRNSNDTSELLEGAPEQDDACDEAPIAISSMEIPEVVGVYSPADQHLDVNGPTQVSTFVSYPEIGVFNPADPPKPYVSRIAYRFCNCYHPTRGPLPLDECVEDPFGPCNTDDAWVSGAYELPTLTNENHVPLLDPAVDSHTITPGQTHAAGPFSWQWYQDSFTYPSIAFDHDGYRAMWAAMVSRVQRGGTVQLSSNTDSVRDSSYDVRDVFFEMGGPTYVRADAIHVPGNIPDNDCIGGHCNLVLRPWLSRINPLPFEERLFGLIPDGGWAAPIGDRIGALRPGRPAIDITDNLSPGIVSALTSGDSIFVSPVETGSELRNKSHEVQALVMPATWSETSEVGVARMTNLGLRLDRERPVDGPVMLTSAQSGNDGPKPEPRTDASLVYSGSAETLFVVGGVDDDELRRDIWRYSVSAGNWRRVAFGAAHAPENVLAATYLAKTRELLVLDETKPTHGPKLARLVAYDTRTNESRLMRVWPRLGVFRKLALLLDNDGQVVLVGGTPVATMLFRMRVDGSIVRFTGSKLVPGELWDLPVSTNAGILVPIKHRQRLDVKRIAWDELHTPRPCWSL